MNPKPLDGDVFATGNEASVVHVRKSSASSDAIVDELDHIGQVQMRMPTEYAVGCFSDNVRRGNQ
jgi:hypothetical protein